MQKHMGQIPAVLLVEEFRSRVNVIDAGHNCHENGTGNQNVCKSRLDEKKSKQLLVTAETAQMNIHGAVNQSQEQDDINAHPFRFRDFHAAHAYNKPADENDGNQNKDDSFESDVFGQFFPKHCASGKDLYTRSGASGKKVSSSL